jgi:hypothetical protein
VGELVPRLHDLPALLRQEVPGEDELPLLRAQRNGEVPAGLL